METIIKRIDNAHRSAMRAATRTGVPHKIERIDGGFRIVPVETIAAPIRPAMTTAELRASAMEHEKALLWREAGDLWDQAISAYPTKGRMAEADIARMTARRDACVNMCLGDRPALFESEPPAAPAGAWPSPPDFSANTHKPYRKKLAALVAAAEARDLAALLAVQINPTSSSPRALIRYRDKVIAAINIAAQAEG